MEVSRNVWQPGGTNESNTTEARFFGTEGLIITCIAACSNKKQVHSCQTDLNRRGDDNTTVRVHVHVTNGGVLKCK